MQLNKQKLADYSCNQLIFHFWLFPGPYQTNLRQKMMEKWEGKKNRIFAKNTHCESVGLIISIYQVPVVVWKLRRRLEGGKG